MLHVTKKQTKVELELSKAIQIRTLFEGVGGGGKVNKQPVALGVVLRTSRPLHDLGDA